MTAAVRHRDAGAPSIRHYLRSVQDDLAGQLGGSAGTRVGAATPPERNLATLVAPPPMQRDDGRFGEEVEVTIAPSLDRANPWDKTDSLRFSRDARLSTFASSVVVRMPDRHAPEYRFELLQQWEGTVLHADDEQFTAVLRDLTDLAHVDEEATFPMSEISDDDAELVVPGGIFYWCIGYQTPVRTGQIQRTSSIRFRRLPVWTPRDLERVRVAAAAFHDLLDDTNE